MKNNERNFLNEDHAFTGGVKNMTLWLDLLCVESFFAILNLSRKHKIKEVYYANRTRLAGDLLHALLEKFLRCSIKQILCWADGQEKIDEVSILEQIETHLRGAYEHYYESSRIAGYVSAFCKKEQCEPEKIKFSLIEPFNQQLYRVVEHYLLAKKFSGLERSIFLVRKTPVLGFVGALFKDTFFYTYTTFFSQWLFISQREKYAYDFIMNSQYYIDRFKSVGRCVALFFLDILNQLIVCIYKKKHGFRWSNVRIGIELVRLSTRMDAPNDIFWIKYPQMDLKSVIVLGWMSYNPELKNILDQYGVKFCMVLRYPSQWKALIQTRNDKNDLVAIALKDWIRSIPYLFRMLTCLLVWNEQSWVRFQMNAYKSTSIFWESIYRQLGIKILWSMVDIDTNKQAKAQAIKNVGGLFVGGHGNFFQTRFMNLEKCQDVLVTWGEYFTKNIFNQYPYLATFITGYPADHYFKEKRPEAQKIRERYKGNYIIAYFDNNIGHQVPFSQEMQVNFYKMLFEILDQYKHTVLFLKPKNGKNFIKNVACLSKFKSYIDLQRIKVFGGDVSSERIVPAVVAGASDLVIGQGLSTAACEAFFAGTISFHIDLTGFINNEFGNNGLNKVVFRDIESLRKSVEDRICGKSQWTYEDYKQYYMILDPYQDGKSYERVGFILRELQKALMAGEKREDSVERVAKRYKIFLNQQAVK